MPQSIEVLSTLVDTSRLQHISICLTTGFQPAYNPLVDIVILLERATSLRSLVLCSTWRWYDYFQNVKSIFWMLPTFIQHVQVDIRSVKQMEELFERKARISSMSFRSVRRTRVQFDDFLSWLTERGTNFTSKTVGHELHVWLGKTGRKNDDILYANKRLKSSA